MVQEKQTQRKARSMKLIANFVNGYAEGWHFAVRECFKNELDIKLTERVEHGKKVLRWTQGNFYCFAEGHRIYDTPKAYLEWREALKHIKLVVEVIRAIPNKLDGNGKLINGQVTFKLSKPNKDKTNVETIDRHFLSQNDFIEFLRTGQLPNQ